MKEPAARTRRSLTELYERVWSTPVIRVAEAFGITNFLLAGICRKHDIPTPPSGHWSKIACNKPTVHAPLNGDGAIVVDIGKVKTPGMIVERVEQGTAGFFAQGRARQVRNGRCHVERLPFEDA